MEKYQFADAFITYGGCNVLAMWLQAFAQWFLTFGSTCVQPLLRCMERLPITKEALKEAGEPLLGKIVATLQTHPEETMTNRKRAQGLVQRWLRQIIAPEVSESLDGFLGGELVGTIPRPPTWDGGKFSQVGGGKCETIASSHTNYWSKGLCDSTCFDCKACDPWKAISRDQQREAEWRFWKLWHGLIRRHGGRTVFQWQGGSWMSSKCQMLQRKKMKMVCGALCSHCEFSVVWSSHILSLFGERSDLWFCMPCCVSPV